MPIDGAQLPKNISEFYTKDYTKDDIFRDRSLAWASENGADMSTEEVLARAAAYYSWLNGSSIEKKQTSN